MSNGPPEIEYTVSIIDKQELPSGIYRICPQEITAQSAADAEAWYEEHRKSHGLATAE
jgi:hypothetical protein